MLGAPPIEIFLVLLLPLRFLLVIPVVQRSRADIYRLPALSGKAVGKVGQRAQNPVADPHAVLRKRLALRIPSLDCRHIRRWCGDGRLGARRADVLRAWRANSRHLLIDWQEVAASSSAAGLMPLVWHEIEVGWSIATVLLHVHQPLCKRRTVVICVLNFEH